MGGLDMPKLSRYIGDTDTDIISTVSYRRFNIGFSDISYRIGDK